MITQPGIDDLTYYSGATLQGGVMINWLCGSKQASAIEFSKHIGKTIREVKLESDELQFEFTDGSKMKILDDGQSCCEHRYMQTDGEIKPVEDSHSEYEDAHEIQFLEIKTSKGVFTMANHNKHNGYYGGFSIIVLSA